MRLPPIRVALRVTLIYAVAAALWILVSDQLLVALVADPRHIGLLATLKGWFFVSVSAAACYAVIQTLARHQERTDVALYTSEYRYRQLVEAIPQLTWRSDATGTCQYFSPQWLAYTGVPPAEQIAGGWLNTVHP